MANVKKVTLKDGATRWRLRLYVGIDPGTGRQEVVRKTFDRKRDADAEVAKLQTQKNAGLVVTPSKERFGIFLRRWLDGPMKGQIRARTYSDYRGVVRNYVEQPAEGFPLVGKVRLDRLSHEHLQTLYDHMREQGLSPRTIRSLHAVLSQALNHAMVSR